MFCQPRPNASPIREHIITHCGLITCADIKPHKYANSFSYINSILYPDRINYSRNRV